METLTTETITLLGKEIKGFEDVFSSDALNFIQKLDRKFCKRRKDLLNKRIVRQEEINNLIFPNFLEETEHIRKTDWKVRS